MQHLDADDTAFLTSVVLGDCFGDLVSEGGLDAPSGEASDVLSGSSPSYKEM